jgi:hypothetical protein
MHISFSHLVTDPKSEYEFYKENGKKWWIDGRIGKSM